MNASYTSPCAPGSLVLIILLVNSTQFSLLDALKVFPACRIKPTNNASHNKYTHQKLIFLHIVTKF